MLQQNEFRNTVFGPFIAHILNPSYCSQINAMNSCIQQRRWGYPDIKPSYLLACNTNKIIV